MDNYNVLILGPGGDKGTVELGALQYMKIKDCLNNLNIIAGVSIGAIIGLLYLCGYEIDDIYKIASETEFLDPSKGINLKEIVEKRGIFSQHTFEEKLKKLVKTKFGIVPTLAQLYEFTGIEFMCVVTNIKPDIQTPEYFSYKTEPHLSCIECALMSSNIPFVFEKKEYKNGIYIDGAFTNPCPIDQYDNGINKILALSVVTLPKKDLSFVEYLMRSIHAPMTQLREIMDKKASKNVLHLKIPISVENSLGLFSNSQDKNRMYMEGFKYAQNFFEMKHKIYISPDISIGFDT